MSFFDNLFNSKTHTNKTIMNIQGRAASAVDYVIKNHGIKTLLSGSLVLKDDFTIGFFSGNASVTQLILATVNIGELEESTYLRQLINIPQDKICNLPLNPIVDKIVISAMKNFMAKVPSLRDLPVN